VLVSWNATDHTLTYWFDGEQAGSLNQDIVAKYEGGLQYAYLGFTAGTGGAHNLQEVHLDSLTAWMPTVFYGTNADNTATGNSFSYGYGGNDNLTSAKIDMLGASVVDAQVIL
jgi:hypothetical protein